MLISLPFFIDTMKFLIVLVALFGLSFASLKEDFEDIAALIPTAELKEVAAKYKTCTEVQKVVKYLQGSEWQKLVNDVRNKEEVIEFKKYLVEAGLNPDRLIQAIHDIIANAGHSGATDDSCTMKQFLDAMKEKIPYVKLMSKIVEKKLSSKDFQEFFNKVSSDKSRELVESVRGLDEVQRLAKALKDMGVDIDHVINLIYGLLGWN